MAENECVRPLTQTQTNALSNYLPKMDLVGPTLSDDIRRAIWRYGADAVKSAVKEATKVKRGRKKEPDWRELRDFIEADARDWLAGKDPFAARSNYAIAKVFAERNPGHSMISTHKRIERKLSSGPYDRRWFTLMSAESQSRDAFPFEAHLRALESLSELPISSGGGGWRIALDRARATLADYEAREGRAPDANMSFCEIETAVRANGLNALLPPLGLLPSSPAVERSSSSLGSILLSAIKNCRD